MSIRSNLILVGLVAGAATAAAQPGATVPSVPVGETETTAETPAEEATIDAQTIPDTRAPGAIAPRVRHRPLDEKSQGLWGGGVRLTGLSGVGALPGVNIGAELAAYLRRDERFLELALGHW